MASGIGEDLVNRLLCAVHRIQQLVNLSRESLGGAGGIRIQPGEQAVKLFEFSVQFLQGIFQIFQFAAGLHLARDAADILPTI